MGMNTHFIPQILQPIRLSLFLLLTILTLEGGAAPSSSANTLFEGYYKILSGDQHIGFVLTRFQFDPKEKKFSTQQLTRISSGGNEVMESLSAVSDETLNPISYKYTSLVGRTSKSIDAKFAKNKMTATVSETGKKNITLRNDLKPGTFLSSFLVYTLLRSPTGMKTNSSYDFSAIAEEDGQISQGQVKVLREEKYKGFSTFRVENFFKKGRFLSFVTDNGEVLATEVKDARLLTELVAKPGDAIGTIGLPESVARTLFGSIPTGEKNVVTTYFNQLEKKTEAPGKQQGFPPGQGVLIKGQSQKPKEEP